MACLAIRGAKRAHVSVCNGYTRNLYNVIKFPCLVIDPTVMEWGPMTRVIGSQHIWATVNSPLTPKHISQKYKYKFITFVAFEYFETMAFWKCLFCPRYFEIRTLGANFRVVWVYSTQFRHHPTHCTASLVWCFQLFISWVFWWYLLLDRSAMSNVTTSWHGSAFYITDPLWEESTVYWRNSLTMSPVIGSIDVSVVVCLDKLLKTLELPVIGDVITLMWRNSNLASVQKVKVMFLKVRLWLNF